MPYDAGLGDLGEYLAGLSKAIDTTLLRYLPPAEPESAPLHEAMGYSVVGAGKRLRAALVTEAAYVCGFEREKALPVACAIEMIHAYSLIHDDLPCMDDDDYRRGKPSNHKVFGEGMAVLAGDALLTHAFSVLARLPAEVGVSAETSLAIIDEIASAAGPLGMVGGQAADLGAEAGSPDANLLEYIHTHKTGALFRACTRAGALLAGAGKEALERLTTFAYHFGIAFQIVDDLLDVKGDPQRLGKQVGRDERRGKLTYPRLYGIVGSERMAEEHLAEAHRMLEPFGEKALRLRQLTQFVGKRQM